jgi:hypothetical protein
MKEDKILTQLAAMIAAMEVLSGLLRRGVSISKNTAVLLKRNSERMTGLLLQHGIETLPGILEENSLLVDQNFILIEQRETDVQSLRLLQADLDALRASHAEDGLKRRAASVT